MIQFGMFGTTTRYGDDETMAKGAWVHVAESFGETLWGMSLAKGATKDEDGSETREVSDIAAMLLDPESMFKARRPAKYLKRVPMIGKFTKGGRQRYRYYYHVQRAGGVHNREDFKAGASFAAGAKPEEHGHYTIHGVGHDGKLQVSHSGDPSKMESISHDDLHDRLIHAHADAYNEHHAKLKSDHKEALEAGNHKAAAKLRAEAEKIGYNPIHDGPIPSDPAATKKPEAGLGKYPEHQIRQKAREAKEAIDHHTKKAAQPSNSKEKTRLHLEAKAKAEADLATHKKALADIMAPKKSDPKGEPLGSKGYVEPESEKDRKAKSDKATQALKDAATDLSADVKSLAAKTAKKDDPAHVAQARKDLADATKKQDTYNWESRSPTGKLGKPPVEAAKKATDARKTIAEHEGVSPAVQNAVDGHIEAHPRGKELDEKQRQAIAVEGKALGVSAGEMGAFVKKRIEAMPAKATNPTIATPDDLMRARAHSHRLASERSRENSQSGHTDEQLAHGEDARNSEARLLQSRKDRYDEGDRLSASGWKPEDAAKEHVTVHLAAEAERLRKLAKDSKGDVRVKLSQQAKKVEDEHEKAYRELYPKAGTASAKPGPAKSPKPADDTDWSGGGAPAKSKKEVDDAEAARLAKIPKTKVEHSIDKASSNISGIAWTPHPPDANKPGKGTMRVRFKGGDTYDWKDVHHDGYEAVRRGDVNGSHGETLNKVIRGNHESTKVAEGTRGATPINTETAEEMARKTRIKQRADADAAKVAESAKSDVPSAKDAKPGETYKQETRSEAGARLNDDYQKAHAKGDAKTVGEIEQYAKKNGFSDSLKQPPKADKKAEAAAKAARDRARYDAIAKTQKDERTKQHHDDSVTHHDARIENAKIVGDKESEALHRAASEAHEKASASPSEEATKAADAASEKALANTWAPANPESGLARDHLGKHVAASDHTARGAYGKGVDVPAGSMISQLNERRPGYGSVGKEPTEWRYRVIKPGESEYGTPHNDQTWVTSEHDPRVPRADAKPGAKTQAQLNHAAADRAEAEAKVHGAAGRGRLQADAIFAAQNFRNKATELEAAEKAKAPADAPKAEEKKPASEAPARTNAEKLQATTERNQAAREAAKADTPNHLANAQSLYGLTDKDMEHVGKSGYAAKAAEHAAAGRHDEAKAHVRLAVKDRLTRDSNRNMSASAAERYLKDKETAAAPKPVKAAKAPKAEAPKAAAQDAKAPPAPPASPAAKEPAKEPKAAVHEGSSVHHGNVEYHVHSISNGDEGVDTTTINPDGSRKKNDASVEASEANDKVPHADVTIVDHGKSIPNPHRYGNVGSKTIHQKEEHHRIPVSQLQALADGKGRLESKAEKTARILKMSDDEAETHGVESGYSPMSGEGHIDAEHKFLHAGARLHNHETGARHEIEAVHKDGSVDMVTHTPETSDPRFAGMKSNNQKQETMSKKAMESYIDKNKKVLSLRGDSDQNAKSEDTFNDLAARVKANPDHYLPASEDHIKPGRTVHTGFGMSHDIDEHGKIDDDGEDLDLDSMRGHAFIEKSPAEIEAAKKQIPLFRALQSARFREQLRKALSGASRGLMAIAKTASI